MFKHGIHASILKPSSKQWMRLNPVVQATTGLTQNHHAAFFTLQKQRQSGHAFEKKLDAVRFFSSSSSSDDSDSESE